MICHYSHVSAKYILEKFFNCKYYCSAFFLHLKVIFFRRCLVSKMNKLLVFLSHQVKYVAKLQPAHKGMCHMLKLNVFWGCNELTTYVNTLRPLFCQNFAFYPFLNPIYCFYIILYAAILKYVLN